MIGLLPLFNVQLKSLTLNFKLVKYEIKTIISCFFLKKHSPSPSYLSEGDDEAAHGLLFTGEADVVGGDEHLPQDVHLVERSPQRAVRVSVQLLVFRETEQRAVSFTFSPGVQIPEMNTEILKMAAFKHSHISCETGRSFTISSATA